MKFDLRRLEEIEKQNYKLYAAFDFFVTAEHILDWKYNDYKTRKNMRRDNILLGITSHIANGVKHFEATDSRHKSVDDITNDSFVEDDYVDPDYMEQPITVQLTCEASEHFGCKSIEVIDLAKQVYDYWKANH